MVNRMGRHNVNLIYHLKRQYGLPGAIYTRTSTKDLTTGVVQTASDVRQIQRIIFLPDDWQRKFAYSRAFIAADKSFTYGGFFDVNERAVMIDFRDLPNGFTITLDTEIIHKAENYHVTQVSKSDENRVWILKIKRFSGEKPYQKVDLHAQDNVNISEQSNGST